MGWFVAVIVRGSFVEDSLHKERLADKLYRLIEAPDAEAAYERALRMIEECDESYTDDDGTVAELRGMGLGDLRAIDAPQLADGVEVYAEAVSEPSTLVKDEKDQLTLFEPDEPPDLEAYDGEAEDPGRFTDDEPIR